MSRAQNRASDAHADDRDQDDKQLVEASKRGDRTAFRVLYQRHHRRAYLLAMGVVRNEDEALDVVQEAFLRAYRSLDRFEGSAAFYTWIYRIVMNVAIDALRRQNRAPKVEYDDAVSREDDALGSLSQPLGFNPGKDLVRKEIRAKIDDALALLSPNHRAVLIMREVDGMSYEEMASAMECSKGTIMSRLFHARKYMQKMLAGLKGDS